MKRYSTLEQALQGSRRLEMVERARGSAMNHETREFIVIIAAALLIIDVVIELTKLSLKHKRGGDNKDNRY